MVKKFKEIHFDTREEWKLARRIGGSDLATIMGEGKWQTINDLFTRIVYPERAKDKKLDKNSRVQEGTQAEKYIRALWQLEHKGYKIIEPPKENWLFVKNNHDFISVSPDGISEDYKCGLEIKDVEVYKNADLEKWKNGEIPKQYFYQIMQYFIVINTLEEIYLVARIKIMKDRKLDHIEEFNYHFTRANFKKEIKSCLEIETKFIEKYIMKKIRPNANYLKELENGNT